MHRKLKLKICGMTHPTNIIQVAPLKPDYLGFIFYGPSPRCVQEEFEMPVLNEVKKVGVFVDESIDRILETVKKYKLEFVQLHGSEAPTACEELSKSVPGVIKSFSISSGFDFQKLNEYKPYVNYFLFDAKGEHPGGNGIAFDWKILSAYDQEVPFFLSGGINISNIGQLESIRDMNIYGLDVNSGVEDRPGMKNINKIKRIKAALHEL